ncbi:hypothetical protein BWD121_000890 [Bartonella sp. WD12.1]|nr:hypothetical protein BWD121_000740 [Bartonella sp. WD12.1]OPB29075.1 hypothetical protein BWD121_000800 [Bartonella sp. WD12.1]OPB29081.1 hypothetical protein BWD121_000860 [Bartonella sp. WD12.1]OPB29084.1 hypothetical protein BWD121_000890 [Bartonella sp. WD12.1]
MSDVFCIGLNGGMALDLICIRCVLIFDSRFANSSSLLILFR